ncbi:NAD-dependent epimerase/dehydratase [Desulfatibacillum aliphaticivorans]|uniref:NAD-dependent epimerase/dehydratase n=1 Tax=Desulfatibacillum aliphaticivorans TaxID=218208 RepID=B8FI18_DESAL|nr:NAD-dependent epimerase/dehydratase family protein [Desulfatibacillum aliphaticivorans]ACL02585.1 NAD-dependent epimerase/dehydratase [Desulfatibacillum aliphaticivorans]
MIRKQDTVMVTGGAGFIGSNLVRQLIEKGVNVRVFHLPGDDLRNLSGLDVELMEGNVLDVDSIKRCMSGCHQVYHLAAIYALWIPNMQLMHKVNVEGARNVMRLAGELDVEKTVYCSSIALFGGQGPDKDADENSPFALGDSGSYYAWTKYASHQVVAAFCEKGLNATIVAPCGPLGPGDYGPTPTGRILTSAVNMPVVFRFRSIANMVDVRDVAAGHILAMEKGEPGRSYLLGGENLAYETIVRTALEIAGMKKLLLPAPAPLARAAGSLLLRYSQAVSKKPPLLTPSEVNIGTKGLRADCSRAKKELGYTPRPLRQSIRDALVWFAKNGYITNKKASKNLLSLR